MTSFDSEEPTMENEKATRSPAGSPTAAVAGDSHKRKLEDLELNLPPKPPSDSEESTAQDSVSNVAAVQENGDADESDSKRPRLETNADGLAEDDDLAPPNGQQEEKKEDEPPEREEPEKEEPEEVDFRQPESANETRQLLKNHEPKEDPAEEPKKEPTEETVVEPLKTITEEHASNEDEKPEIQSAVAPGHQEAELEHPADQLLGECDVPIPFTDTHTSSDCQILSRKMEVPNDKVGVLIGKAGDTIRSLQDNSGAKIQIVRDAEVDPQSVTRPLELVGTLENINKAEKLIRDVIAEADAGGSPSLVARGFSTVQAASGGEQLEIQVPLEKVGLIIGKGGETIRNLQTRSGARIQLIQQNLSDGEQPRERTVRVTGNKKQIETAREMIKDVMNQNIRPSPLSGGYSHQAFRPRGPATPQWGPRGPYHTQLSGYNYPQRGQYSSQSSQYPPPTYGNYPPSQAPRSNFGPGWEQRPSASMHGPSPQGTYPYGQQQGPDYGHPPPYSQNPAQPYGHGYNEAKYGHHSSSQHYGHMQPTHYAQTGVHSGYGPHDQYSKPPVYGMPPQVPHSQTYGQPRPSQSGEMPYQAPASSAQSYGQNVPPQQSYPYASSGPMQQSYPPYGYVPTSDGYGHTASASTCGYPPQGGQPVAAYGQPGAQQPPMYPQAGPAGGYGSYPTAQPGYAEQPAAANPAYGFQGPVDPAYGGPQGPAPAAAYPAAAAGQSGYAQPSQSQPSYDQTVGYGNAPAPAGYGKSV